MTLTAGYYSDANLWFMFTIMVVYKYGLTLLHEVPDVG